MRLGLGLSICNTQGAAETFDPATLTLTGWWRSSFAASPWVGVASEGDSGSHDLTEATNPPGTAAIGAYTAADFDGTNDLLSGTTMGTYVGASAGSIWALVNIDSIDTVSADNAAYNNDAIVADGGAIVGLHVSQTGPTAQAYFDDDTGTVCTASLSFSLSTWTLLQMRWNDSAVEIRKNNGSWTSVANGSGVLHPSFSAATLRVGRNWSSAFLDGRIADLGMASSRLSDDDFDNVRTYINGRYGLAI